jgi:ATP-dependent RNA helicase RhlB
MKLLLGILKREKPESAIIFCNTKRYAEIVAKRLRINGIACEFIMGDLPQSQRLKIIEAVKSGKTRFLAATDVAARGLDIEALAMVVNYDLPIEEENYVHRIGRTARAGKTGKAITLVSEQDVYGLPAIERYVGRKLPSEIATEELFGEDKSAGIRIKIERDDDDRQPVSRNRDNPGERRTPPSGGEPRRRSDRGKDHGGRGKSAENTRSQDERRPPRRDRTKDGPEPDISTLSFDDRMAYYKRKYDPAFNGKGEGKNGRGTRNRESSRKKRDAGRQADSNRGSGKQGARQAPRDGGKAANSRPESEMPGSPVSASQSVLRAEPQGETSQPAAGAPQKQGLLTRLLGIFKSKKQKE